MSLGYTTSNQNELTQGRVPSGFPVTSTKYIKPTSISASAAHVNTTNNTNNTNVMNNVNALAPPPRGGGMPQILMRIEAIELALATLSDHIQDDQSDAVANLSQRIEQANALIRDVATAATMQVSAEIVGNVAIQQYANLSGDCEVDVMNSHPLTNTPQQNAKKVRLLYPQIEVNNKVYMNCIQVDDATMEVKSTWLCVYDHDTDKRYVEKFSI